MAHNSAMIYEGQNIDECFQWFKVVDKMLINICNAHNMNICNAHIINMCNSHIIHIFAMPNAHIMKMFQMS